MTQTLLNVIADIELSFAAAVSVGATTATLSSAVDGNGVAIPAGKYGFTIDGDNSAKEFIVCDLSGTALTNIQSVTVQGATSSGFANYHRIGATVTITDWVILKRMLDNLNGTTGFNSATPINYDAEPSYADPLTIPTVQFVLDTASGGTVTFDRQIINGDAGETIVAGDWVYFNTTDGEWYKTDADDTAKCLNVRIGKAIGAGTDGNAIAGGIFVSGTETVGAYVAGTTYYLSNTAGELSTSAGTNSVVVGVGDANSFLQLRQITPNQVDAAQGGSTFGNPSSSNKFLTQEYNASATGLPVVRTYTTVSSSIGSSTTQFDITEPVADTIRYTWDSTGTDPGITALTVPVGSLVNIRAQNFNANNNGLFLVTGSGTNYFEVTNASGVAEVDKTIGTGHIVISGTTFWTKPSGLKYIQVEVVGGGGGTASSTGAGGGGAGGYSRKLIAASALSATVPFIVGAAGLSQENGRNTSFSTILQGLGGSVSSGTAGGAGGSATGGDVNVSGGVGGNGDTSEAILGSSGSSYFGGSSAYGAGGKGTSVAGNQGVIILTEYYS